MLFSSNVEVNRHEFVCQFLAVGLCCVVGIQVAQEIPGGVHKRVHRVRLPPGRSATPEQTLEPHLLPYTVLSQSCINRHEPSMAWNTVEASFQTILKFKHKWFQKTGEGLTAHFNKNITVKVSEKIILKQGWRVHLYMKIWRGKFQKKCSKKRVEGLIYMKIWQGRFQKKSGFKRVVLILQIRHSCMNAF